jgi:hypothetical protein
MENNQKRNERIEFFEIMQKKQKYTQEERWKLLKEVNDAISELTPRPFDGFYEPILKVIFEYAKNWQAISRVCKHWRNLCRTNLFGQLPYKNPSRRVGWICLKLLKDKLFNSVRILLCIGKFGYSVKSSHGCEYELRVDITLLDNGVVCFKADLSGVRIVDKKGVVIPGPLPGDILERFGWKMIDNVTWTCTIEDLANAFDFVFDYNRICPFAMVTGGWEKLPERCLFFECICDDGEIPCKERFTSLFEKNKRCLPVCTGESWENNGGSWENNGKEITLIPRYFWK